MSEIQQGLLIAAIGMGLVFAVIVFLWGLMALMMRLTSGKKVETGELAPPDETDEPLVPEMQVAEGQRRAIAAAVVIELAIAASRTSGRKQDVLDRAGGLSPWQSIHRARQLEQKNTRG